MSSIKRRMERGEIEPHTAQPHSYRWAMKVENDWIDLQCQFNDFGERCPHYGTLSPATNGRGPWYCRNHFGQSGVRAYRDRPLPGPTPPLSREPGEDRAEEVGA